MFKLFSKQPATGETLQLKIDGMHCVSCALSIDGELEDTDGVICATTHFAKSQTSVEYNPDKVSKQQIIQVIENTGYQVK